MGKRENRWSSACLVEQEEPDDGPRAGSSFLGMSSSGGRGCAALSDSAAVFSVRDAQGLLRRPQHCTATFKYALTVCNVIVSS